jgi:hypothetical protein
MQNRPSPASYLCHAATDLSKGTFFLSLSAMLGFIMGYSIKYAQDHEMKSDLMLTGIACVEILAFAGLTGTTTGSYHFFKSGVNNLKKAHQSYRGTLDINEAETQLSYARV